MSFGFCSWISGNNKIEATIQADIGEVILSPSLINDYKFSFGNSTGITYFNHTTIENSSSSINKNYIDYIFYSEIFANISNNELFYSQSYDSTIYNKLFVKVQLKNSNETILNRNNNVIESVTIFPSNYEHFSFKLNRVDNLVDTYFIPFKSKKEISMFYIAMLDQSKSSFSSKADNYMVPITFSFNIMESSIGAITSSFNIFDFSIWLE